MKQPLTISSADLSANRFSMLRLLKRIAFLALLAAGVQAAHGFAFLGPFEAYQVPAIGYRWDIFFNGPGGVVGYSDAGGPHNIAEEYRRNTPVLYYACNANFLEYFGSNGVAAVDQAFAIMNSLTNVSQYSPDLSEFPLQSQRINTEAQAFALTDVKSMALHVVLQQLGVAPPDQHTWTLHERTGPASPLICPAGMTYFVIMRNFDVMPTGLQTPQYSAYVNGVLYTYGIIENCNGPLLAYTIPYAVDADADTYTSVAAEPAWIGAGLGTGVGLAGVNAGGTGLKLGGFYTYLTRDDVGGLRYLLQTNNYNIESSGPDTVQFVTNNTPQTLITLDLGLLIAQSATNSAAALQALYPGLIVNQVSNWFGLLVTTNITQVVVPAPFRPAGFVQVKTVTTFTTNIVQFFQNTFDNIITNSFFNQTIYQVQTVSPGNAPFSPAGSPPTLLTTTKTFKINSPSGDFYILPTNLCAIKILNSNLLATTIITTNLISTTTNTTTGGGTTSNQNFTVSTVNYFTNHVLVYLPVTCPANTVGLRQGIEQVRFVRRDFDSLIGTFWAPATNTYTVMELTNNALQPQQFQRVVTQPDFLFSAADLASGPQVAVPISDTVLRTALRFSQVVSNGLAGPGTIQSPSTFTFNKVGILNYNATAVTLSGFFNSDQSSAIRGLLWASFDGTTNEPVVYPNGTSIANLINQLLIQVQPQSLPNGTNGVPYSFVYTNTVSGVVYTNTLSVTGGQAPYTWSLAPGSPGLPTGLSLSSSGQITGTPSGNSPSTYDFTVRVTDAGARFVDVPLAITIVP
jgi:Putative Ig domain